MRASKIRRSINTPYVSLRTHRSPTHTRCPSPIINLRQIFNRLGVLYPVPYYCDGPEISFFLTRPTRPPNSFTAQYSVDKGRCCYTQLGCTRSFIFSSNVRTLTLPGPRVAHETSLVPTLARLTTYTLRTLWPDYSPARLITTAVPSKGGSTGLRFSHFKISPALQLDGGTTPSRSMCYTYGMLTKLCLFPLFAPLSLYRRGEISAITTVLRHRNCRRSLRVRQSEKALPSRGTRRMPMR